MPASRRKTESVLFPIAPGREGAVRGALDQARGRLHELFSRATTLHFARFVVLPPAGPDGKPSLLLETTFDGDEAAHLAELWALAGAELARVLVACDGFPASAKLLDFQRAVEKRRAVSAGFEGPDPRLTVTRIQQQARLRDAVEAVLARDRSLLATRSPGDILAHVQGELRAALPAESDGEGRDVSALPGDENRVIALVSLFSLLVASMVHDFADFVTRLWHEPPGTTGTESAPERERAPVPSLPSRSVQRAFTHRAALKQGAFRRRALRRALAWLTRHQASSGDVANPVARVHSLRWLITADGQLLFTAQHDGSIRARLAEFGAMARAVIGLVWSSTRASPWTTAGGSVVPSLERLSLVAEAHELSPAFVYSAYPMLTVGDLADNAEISELLRGEPSAGRGERLLELV